MTARKIIYNTLYNMFLQVREKEVVAIAGGFIEHAGEDWRTSMQVMFFKSRIRKR